MLDVQSQSIPHVHTHLYACMRVCRWQYPFRTSGVDDVSDADASFLRQHMRRLAAIHRVSSKASVKRLLRHSPDSEDEDSGSDDDDVALSHQQQLQRAAIIGVCRTYIHV